LARQKTRQALKDVADEEDQAPVSKYAIAVGMTRYFIGGVFQLPDPKYQFYFANPKTHVEVDVPKGKAHTSRLISCTDLMGSYADIVDQMITAEMALGREYKNQHYRNIWQALQMAFSELVNKHEGDNHVVLVDTTITIPTYGMATGMVSTRPLFLSVGMQRRKQYLTYFTKVGGYFHTVCPSMITDADGHSHTQRALLTWEIVSDWPPFIGPLIDAADQRFQHCQAAMKIPDEAVHVLRAYETNCYVEGFVTQAAEALVEAAPRMWLQGVPAGTVVVHAESYESIFPNDLIAELTFELATEEKQHAGPGEADYGGPGEDEGGDQPGDASAGGGLPG